MAKMYIYVVLLLCVCFCLDNEELRKEFAALANEVGDYIDQKGAILANMSLQGGSLEVSFNYMLLQHSIQSLFVVIGLNFFFNELFHFLAFQFYDT